MTDPHTQKMVDAVKALDSAGFEVGKTEIVHWDNEVDLVITIPLVRKPAEPAADDPFAEAKAPTPGAGY
jgi:hypothetical protein